VVARGQGGNSAFIDLDSLPEDGALGVGASIRFLLGSSAGSLRNLLVEEAVVAADVVIRQGARRAFNQLSGRLASQMRPSLPFFGRLNIFPDFESTSVPFLIPRKKALINYVNGEMVGSSTSESSGNLNVYDRLNLLRRKVDGVAPVLASPRDVVDKLFPKLSREEELYAIALADLCSQSLGPDVGRLVKGDILLEPNILPKLILHITRTASSARGDAISGILQNINPEMGIRENILRLAQGKTNARRHDGVNSKDDDRRGMDELVTALTDLSGEESAILQQTLSSVGGQLVDGALERLQPLLVPQSAS